MAERDYSYRPVLDKLGLKPGAVVALSRSAWRIDDTPSEQVLERTGRPLGGPNERPDVVPVAIDRSTDAVAELELWKYRMQPAGGVCLLTPKRGSSRYVNQNELRGAGNVAGLVDNEMCSFSDAVSGMRFVFRKEDRVHRAG